MVDITALGDQLKEALAHLYDPVWLRASPLIALLELHDEPNPAQALRHALEEAIEALRPAGAGSPDSPGWRSYHILHGRYVQQFTQRDIANQLGVSTRHLRRQQDEAIMELAMDIHGRYGLARRASMSHSDHDTEPESDFQAMSREMGWLSDSMSDELSDVARALAEAGELADTLALHRQVTLEVSGVVEAPQAALPQTVLKEAILAVWTALIQAVPGGSVAITNIHRDGQVSIEFLAEPARGRGVDPGSTEGLDMASRLIQVFGGRLDVTPRPASLLVRMYLPPPQMRRVLAIEDNIDTLQLWRRYLQGTRFQLVGVTDPQQALEQAVAVRPDVIVLDLMMPGVDGWALLGHLRNHPRTCMIPIIVCTVLPQRELALSLGARAFMRKPVTRQTFRSELARQTGAEEPASPRQRGRPGHAPTALADD